MYLPVQSCHFLKKKWATLPSNTLSIYFDRHPITTSYMISVFKTESVFGRFFGLKHKIPKKDTPHTCQESTRTNSQCGNFEIFLFLRFYVKSTLVESQKNSFL